MKRLRIFMVLALIGFLSPSVVDAQTQVPQHVVGTAGASAVSTNFSMNGTLTQTAVGAVVGGTKIGALGFWYLVQPPQVELVIPDTSTSYASSIEVPVRISNTTGLGIVAAELQITYDNTVVTLGSPNKTNIVGTLVAAGWSVEENILPGSGTIDTLSIAMSTAQDTLTNEGVLIYLVLDVADIRTPSYTPLNFEYVLMNDGDPTVGSTDGSLTLTGSDGTVSALPDSINPGDVVNITVTDIDLDLDVGNPDQVSATALGKGYNDSQTVTLTETGANTGIFTGSVNTQFALAAGASEDGVITTIAGDSICVSFVDLLTSLGNTVTRYDTVEVIGGEDGVVLASFVVQALDGRAGVRDTVRVQVSDSDLDLDVGVAEQVSATIVNTVSGESEGLVLTETGVNTGVFQVRVPTVSGASGVNNNGELSLVSEDTLSVTYVDSLTAQGGVSPVVDVTQVVNLFGDVRSNDQVQAFDAASVLAQAVSLNVYAARDSLLGDVDGNGDIQAFDASQILQYVVRLINRFPVQVDDSLNPPLDEKNHPFLKPVLMDRIALGNLQVQDDDTYLLPVSLLDRDGILSGTLTLGVDAGVEVLDVLPGVGYDGFMTAHNTTSEGIKVAFAGSQSALQGAGDVLMLKLRSTDPNVLRLSLDHIVLNGQTLTPSVNIESIAEVEMQSNPLITQVRQNVPNPFNPQTTIRYDLARDGQVHVVIYGVTGQRVRTLVSEHQASGSYQVVWDGKDGLGRSVSSGVYMMRFLANDVVQTRKMLLLR